MNYSRRFRFYGLGALKPFYTVSGTLAAQYFQGVKVHLNPALLLPNSSSDALLIVDLHYSLK